MKLIIAGGRYFADDLLMTVKLQEHIFANGKPKEIVSGGNKTWLQDQKRYIGADYFGELWARYEAIPIRVFMPNWDMHGKAAGPIRNKEMAAYADFAVIFWDGKSKGSKIMIDEMRRLNKPFTVISY